MFVVAMMLLLYAAGVSGQDSGQKAEQKQGGGDLRAAVQNPVGSLISVPLRFTVDFGTPDGSAFLFNVNPVLPVTVGDWNLISRALIPALVSVEGPIGGTPQIPRGTKGDGVIGLGDINYSLFLSPAKPGKAIWGLGPSIGFPSATDDQLGSGKWSAGPTGVLLFQPKWGTIGGLARQLWSFAGDDDRAHVNQLLLQPFVNYNLSKGWYLLTDLLLTANWNASLDQRWTVPLGGGVGKLFKIGKQPINSRVEAYYNVVRPDSAPDWQMVFQFQFLFPK
jgi:hypothetical protein